MYLVVNVLGFLIIHTCEHVSELIEIGKIALLLLPLFVKWPFGIYCIFEELCYTLTSVVVVV